MEKYLALIILNIFIFWITTSYMSPISCHCYCPYITIQMPFTLQLGHWHPEPQFPPSYHVEVFHNPIGFWHLVPDWPPMWIHPHTAWALKPCSRQLWLPLHPTQILTSLNPTSWLLDWILGEGEGKPPLPLLFKILQCFKAKSYLFLEAISS